MRVAVFGAGAVGSLLGALLSEHGNEVLLVGRPDHVQAIRRSGLTLEGRREGTFRIPATESLPEDGRFDRLILTVKSYDVAAAGREVSTRLRPPVPVLALENGLGIESMLRAGLTEGGWVGFEAGLVRGINSIPVTLVEPGRVRLAGEGEVVLPKPPDDTAEAAIGGFEGLLRGSGVPVRLSPEFEREVWRKLLVNAAVNPVTADHGVLNGRLTEEPWRSQALVLLREAQTAARLEGFDFDDASAAEALWNVVYATAENRSSMLQDLDRGRPTEIDAISGAVLDVGRRHEVELPATRRVVDRIRRRVAESAAARRQASWTGPAVGGP